MARVKKKLLNIGPGINQVGLNVTADTEARQLMHSGGNQVITGEKIFTVPPQSPGYPIFTDSAVPKKALLENTRCAAMTVTDIFNITREDLQNGYVTLSQNVAPGKNASLEIVEFEGAPGLALNQDFGLMTNPDGSINKLQWQGWALGRPGVMIEGQRMVVRYSACRDSLYGKLDMTTIFMARVEDKADPESFINQHLNKNHIVTVDDSEKHIELVRLSNGETIRIKLPQITGSSGLGLTSAGGKLLLYSTPVPQIEDIGQNGLYRVLRSRYPFVSGAFNVYEYDGNGWILKLTDDMHDEFDAMKTLELVDSLGEYPLLMDVVPVGRDKLGLYMSWRSTKYVMDTEHGYQEHDGECVAELKIFGPDYHHVATRRVTKHLDSSIGYPFKYHAYSGPFLATGTDFVPSCDGAWGLNAPSWPILGSGRFTFEYPGSCLVPLDDSSYVTPGLVLERFRSLENDTTQYDRKQLGSPGEAECVSYTKGDISLFYDSEYSSEQYIGVFDALKCELMDLRGTEAFTHYKNAKQQGYRGLLVLNM